MKVKTGVSLVAMLAALAFGPREGRDILLQTPPDRLYGEVEVFTDGSLSWSVARNASAQSVELLDASSVRVRSAAIEGSSFYTSDADKKVYPGSLAVVERSRALAPAKKQIRIGDMQPRPPRRLYIVTEAEALHEFLWPGIIIFLAVILTYMINDYSWECGSPIRDIIESEE